MGKVLTISGEKVYVEKAINVEVQVQNCPWGTWAGFQRARFLMRAGQSAGFSPAMFSEFFRRAPSPEGFILCTDGLTTE